MYGMKAPNSRKKYCAIHEYDSGSYAAYSKFVDGVDDRIGWDNQKKSFNMPVKEQDVDDYFSWVYSNRYAEDIKYPVKLSRLYRELDRNGVFDVDVDYLGTPDAKELLSKIVREVGQYDDDMDTVYDGSRHSWFKLLLLPVLLLATYKLFKRFKH